MPDPITVLLVEAQTLTRIGVRTVLSASDDINLEGEATNAAEGIEMFRSLEPDVAILSLRMPDSCAIDDIDNYFIANPSARIIVLAEHAGDAEIARALKKGAKG